jgi:hypothetical protein
MAMLHNKLRYFENINVNLSTLKRLFRAEKIVTDFTHKFTIKIYNKEKKESNINKLELIYSLMFIMGDMHCRKAKPIDSVK